MKQHGSTLPSQASRHRLIGALLRRAALPLNDPRRITPAEAEARAQRWGCELSRRPGPDEHDPQTEDYWTLPMAIAWIATGSLQAVREQFEPYTAECIDWHGGPDVSDEAWQPWRLEQRKPPSAAALMFYVDADPDGPDYESAKDAFVRHMRRPGSFRATGRLGGGPRRPISDLEWLDLEIREYRGADIVAPLRGLGVLIDDARVRFTDILIGREDLLREWLDPAGAKTPPETSMLGQEAVPSRTPPKRRTGPAPALREGVTARMLGDLRAEKISPHALDGTTGDALAAEYGCSRGTAVAARTVALSKFGDHEP